MASNPKVRLCPADKDFFEPFYQIRCEQENIYWTGHATSPSKESLYAWFKKQLNNPTRLFFAIFSGDKPVGYLYIDTVSQAEKTVEISYGISALASGRGIATVALQEALSYARKNLSARLAILHIAESNIASIRVAEKTGFEQGQRTKKVYYAAAEKTFWLRQYRKPLEGTE